MIITWIVIGLIIGLFGWMLYWAGLPIIGALVGAGAGGALGYLASALFPPTTTWALPFLTGVGLVIGGIVGAYLIKTLALYFFFMAGASVGGALAWNLLGGNTANVSGGGWIFVVVAAGVGGALMVWLRRFIIAVVTAILGAMIFAQGLPIEYQLLGLLIALVSFLAIQIGLVNRFVDREAFDRRTRKKFRDDRPDVRTVD